MLFSREYILRATVTVALIFSFHQAGAVAPKGKGFEQRYLWVVRNTLISPETIDQLLEFATVNRFNHLLVQVRGRGDAFYNSDLVPKSNLIKDQSFDPLGYLLPRAHERGIHVHAWVNVYLLWSSRVKPLQKDHLVYTHPDWIDQSSMKPLNLKSELRKLNGGKNGNEGLYLAPHHPAVNLYLLTVFRELVAKYPIDGLHLDYVRYHDSDFGKNPGAIAHYKRNQGEESLGFMNGSDGKGQDYVSTMGRWSDYRRKAITDLVRDTKNLLLEIRPNCILSAAVKPNLYRARERYFQEWDVWLAAGYLDRAIVMNYTPALREFASNIDVIYDNLPSKYRRKIIMGIAAYNQGSKDAADKLKYTMVTRFHGVSIFSYNSLIKDPRYIRTLKPVLMP